MLPLEHPAIDYIPFPDPLEIETRDTEGKAARQGGLREDARAQSSILSRPLDAYQCFQICTSLENVYSHLTISVLSLLTVTQAWCWLIQNPDKHCAGRQEELLGKRSRESSIRKFRKKSSEFAAYMQVLCVLL